MNSILSNHTPCSPQSSLPALSLLGQRRRFLRAPCLCAAGRPGTLQNDGGGPWRGPAATSIRRAKGATTSPPCETGDDEAGSPDAIYDHPGGSSVLCTTLPSCVVGLPDDLSVLTPAELLGAVGDA